MRSSLTISLPYSQGWRRFHGLLLGLAVCCAPLEALSRVLPGDDSDVEETVSQSPLEEAVYDLGYYSNREDDYLWADVLEARIKAGEPLPDWSHSHPPADGDTPRRHLAYWSRFDNNDETPEPTAAAREKLLMAVQLNPSRLATLLRFLPQTEDAARKIAAILEVLPREPYYNHEVHRSARVWVYRHSGLLRDEVIADAIRTGSGKDEDGKHQESALAALQERESDFASGLATSLTYTPDAVVAARAAATLVMSSDADLTPDWRDWLIAAAANPELQENAREMATEALLAAKWKYRDQWAVRFLEDGEGVDPGWFFDDVRAARDTWIPRLVGMIGGQNRRAHERAVCILAWISPSPETLHPLLPWLDDPTWAGEQGQYVRSGFLDGFKEVRIPEAIPHLERALSNKSDSWDTARVASALAFHQAKQAVPAMKAALARCEGRACASIADSMQSLGGFSQEEIFAGLEHFFITCPSQEKREDMAFRPEDGPKDPRIWIGVRFADEPPWDQASFDRLSSRATGLIQQNPQSGSGLLDLLLRMKQGDVSPVAAVLLASGQISGEQLGKILPRVSKPGWNPEPFRALVGKEGVLGGFAAVLASDRKVLDSILKGDDKKAIHAVLVSAPLVDGLVAVEQVIPLLDSKDEKLADTAEDCLGHGGPDFRHALLLHERATAGEDGFVWDPANGKYAEYDAIVRKAMDLFHLPTGPDDLFELSESSQGGNSGRWMVLAYQDSGVAYHESQGGRSGFARLDKERMERFRSYVTRYRVDELPPLVQPIMDGVSFFYAHSSGDNKQTVFMNNPPGAGSWNVASATVPTGKERYSKGIVIYSGLVRLFTDLVDELSFTWAHGNSGGEILIPRETAEIVSVWKQADDLRVLVWDRWGARFWISVELPSCQLGKLMPSPPLPEAGWYVHPNESELKKLDPDRRPYSGVDPLRPLQPAGEGKFWVVDGKSIYSDPAKGLEVNTRFFRLSPGEAPQQVSATLEGADLECDAIWIEEKGGIIYGACNGDLVRFPVKF